MDEIGIKSWKIPRGKKVTAQLEVTFIDDSLLRIIPYFSDTVDRIVQVALYRNESLEALLFGAKLPFSSYYFAFWSRGDVTQQGLAKYWRAAANNSELVRNSTDSFEAYEYWKIAKKLGEDKIKALERGLFGEVRKPKSVQELYMALKYLHTRRENISIRY